MIERDPYMLDTINITVCCPKSKHVPVGFGFKFGLPTLKERKHMPATVTITNEQKVTATLAPVTATGKPAKLDGIPTWTVQSGDSVVNVAADGLSAEVVSSDTPGDTQILIEADADLGAGVVTVSDILSVTVQGAQAQSLGLTVGEPVAK